MNVVRFILLLTVAIIGCEDALPPLPTSTPPASQPAASAPARLPAFRPLHGGVPLALSDDRGFLEWIYDPEKATARVYYFDSNHQPLADISSAVLQLSTQEGPQILPLRACEHSTGAQACGTVTSEWLRDTIPTGLIRFELDREPMRVLLPRPVKETMPADLAVPPSQQ